MKTHHLFRSQRGSLLIVAMLLAAVIGISLVSYLNLATNSLRQAQRSYLANATMNLSEVGLEYAIYAFNNVDELGASAAFTGSGFTLNADGSAQRTIPSTSPYYYDVGENARGVVKVWVQNYAGSTPRVVSRSIVTPPKGNTMEKWVMVTLRKRSIFSYGMVAKDQISFSGGNVYADSWNSDPDNDSATAAVPYSAAVKDDNVIVGCTSTGNGMIDISNGEVLGFVATGGGTMSKGPGGMVHSIGTLTHDANRVTSDFSAQFPQITAPSPSGSGVYSITSNITGTTTFPRGTDVPVVVNGVNTYYYVFSSGAGINPNGNNDITVGSGHCVFILNNHSGTTAISTSGNQDWTISSGAKMTVYTNGNVSIAGTAGINNGNSQPVSCLIYSTDNSASSTQTIDIKGNGQLKAVVYAPNATVGINGGGSSGEVMGSIVGKRINLTGGANFHYDESLGNLTAGNPYAISAWRELTSSSERSTYSSVLGF